MLPTYRDAEGSYYRETEGEGAPHHQTEKDSSGHYPGGKSAPVVRKSIQASALDPKIGVATVYRMVNTLESIGAISRKNMYRVACSTKAPAQ